MGILVLVIQILEFAPIVNITPRESIVKGVLKVIMEMLLEAVHMLVWHVHAHMQHLEIILLFHAK